MVNVIPVPFRIETGSGAFPLRSGIRIEYAEPPLTRIVERLCRDVLRRTGLQLQAKMVMMGTDGAPSIRIEVGSARRFSTVREVERLIDVLALYKLNVLNIHFTDDQGWRLPFGRPESLASADPNDPFYSVADVRELVSYAAERFVTLVPEVDAPGLSSFLRTDLPTVVDAGRGDVLPFVAHSMDIAREENTELGGYRRT